MQVAETYSDKDDKQLSLITYVSVEPAHKSDANALIPVIEDTQKRGLGPKEVLADTAYGSDDNCEKAKELGVEVVSPVKGTDKKALSLADFTLSDRGKVIACPQGHAPMKTKHKKNRYSAAFNSELCTSCPCINNCPVKPGKKAHYLRYDDKAVCLSVRRAYEKTFEFQDRYRFRAGSEATNSEYDRKTGVKRLRVRGLKAVSLAATLKAAAINIFRAAAFRNRPDTPNRPIARPTWPIWEHIRAIKEQWLSKLHDFVVNFAWT